jgi:hypothetical protein
MFDNFGGKALVGAAPLPRQARMKLGVAAEMELVQYCVFPRNSAAPGLPLPVEIRVDYDGFCRCSER